MALVLDAQKIAREFFKQGEEAVFVTRCCGRLYVGTDEAETCGSCKKELENIRVTNLNEVAGALQ